MKKVMSVNLGGLVFPIDDEAYEKLSLYIDALQRQFAGTEGSDEIIGDIEYRIAEIFQERVKGGVESIASRDVEDIVRIMGAPRDLHHEASELDAPPVAEAATVVEEPTPVSPVEEPVSAEGEPEPEPAAKSSRKANPTIPAGESGPKRFFRNTEDKLVGGVCSGFAAYIDADPLMVRLAFLLAVLGFGMGPLIYIVLWIIVPEAKTTSEKLQMRGEKVTVESIEKAIRREAKDLKKRFKDIKTDIQNDPKGFEKKVEKKANDFFVEAGSPFQRLVAGAARLLTFVFSLALLLVVLSLLLGLATGAGAVAWMTPEFGPLLFDNIRMANWAYIGILAVVGIPLILIAMRTLRGLLGMRTRFSGLNTVFLSVWGISLGLVLFLGVQVASEFGREVSFQEEVPIIQTGNKTLTIKRLETPVRHYRTNDRVNIDNVRFTDDTVFFGDLDVNIRQGTDNRFALFTTLRARGRDRAQAVENAKAISHRVRMSDSVLSIAPEFSLSEHTWRGQEMDLMVEIPVGGRLVLDESLRGMLHDAPSPEFLGDEELYNQPLMMTTEGLVPARPR